MIAGAPLPPEAAVVRLYRFPPKSDEPIACEAMIFPGGWKSIDTTLRRAAISGRVEIDGEIEDHFADVLDEEQSIVAVVALDARSFGALKNKWMRCKVEHDPRRRDGLLGPKEP